MVEVELLRFLQVEEEVEVPLHILREVAAAAVQPHHRLQEVAEEVEVPLGILREVVAAV